MAQRNHSIAGPDDVGRRLAVRRVLRTRDPDTGRPSYGDVLGELLSWQDGLLTLRRRDGTVVEIDESDVVAAKPIPPPPARRR